MGEGREGERFVSLTRRLVTFALWPSGQDAKSSTCCSAKPPAPCSLSYGPERLWSFPNRTQRALWRPCLHPSSGPRVPTGETNQRTFGSGFILQASSTSRLGFLFCNTGDADLADSPDGWEEQLTGRPEGCVCPCAEERWCPARAHAAAVLPHILSSWRPRVAGESGAPPSRRPELESQPAHCCGMWGRFPSLSEQCVPCN